MRYFLSSDAALKRIESASLYHITKDDLYELDEEAMDALLAAGGPEGAPIPSGDFLGYCIEEGILNDSSPRRPHPPVIQSPVPSLRYLELQITDSCNLRCRHCYLEPGGRTDLSPEAIDRVLAEFERMQGLRVMITGGEPLMHPAFERINQILPAFALRTVLFTNGTLMDRAMIARLNVHEVQVSIDGMEASHDALRGRGSYKKAMDCIYMAREAGLEVSVSTMIHRGNLGEFARMNALFGSIGLRDWTVDAPAFEGALRHNPELYLSPEEAGPCFEYGWGAGLHGGGEEGQYACGHHLIAVGADGRCSKCLFYADRPVGNIDEGLEIAWRRTPEVKLSDLACDCEAMESCRGGCRYRAEIEGDPLGKDYYKCAFYDKINK